jgi:hypothetical protein
LKLISSPRASATVIVSTMVLMLLVQQSYGAECSGATYNTTAFEKEVSQFSPYEKVYLIIDCTGITPGEHTMHANWIHKKRGMIRSDKHSFIAQAEKNTRGIYFWFKLSKKGPMASMFSNQDFHEENFGEWSVETYFNDELVITKNFTITESVQ